MMKAATPRRQRVARWMRERGWNDHTGGVRNRIYSLVVHHRPWYDWGGKLMIVVGRQVGGSWEQPSPPTWWYRFGAPKRMIGTGFPRHRLSTFEIVIDYDEFQKRTKGLSEDQRKDDRWKAIGVNCDDELCLGRQYWGGSFHGLSKPEVAILRRYLRAWRRSDWYGLRTWLYLQGLHASVHLRRPFACNQAPSSKVHPNGYSHFHCQLKRRHDGLHRFNSYTWGEIGGKPIDAYHRVDD